MTKIVPPLPAMDTRRPFEIWNDEQRKLVAALTAQGMAFQNAFPVKEAAMVLPAGQAMARILQQLSPAFDQFLLSVVGYAEHQTHMLRNFAGIEGSTGDLSRLFSDAVDQESLIPIFSGKIGPRDGR